MNLDDKTPNWPVPELRPEKMDELVGRAKVRVARRRTTRRAAGAALAIVAVSLAAGYVTFMRGDTDSFAALKQRVEANIEGREDGALFAFGATPERGMKEVSYDM